MPQMGLPVNVRYLVVVDVGGRCESSDYSVIAVWRDGDGSRPKEIVAQAERMGQDPETFKKNLTDQQKDYLKDSAAIRKALDLMKEGAVIEEKKEEPAEPAAEEKPAKKAAAKKPAAKKAAAKAEDKAEESSEQADAAKAEDDGAEKKPAKKPAAKKTAKAKETDAE